MWVLCAGVSWSFPVVAVASGAYAFGFFALMMVLQFILVLIIPAGDQRCIPGRIAKTARGDGLA